MQLRNLSRSAVVAVSTLAAAAAFAADWPPAKKALVVDAIANMLTLDRAGEIGLATVFDGNKFVQCRRLDDRSIRCEAAGTLLQPSMSHTLTPAKLEALEAFGWTLDPSFGNWVQNFPADTTPQKLQIEVESALTEVYGVDPATLETRTDWVAKEECPPRRGFTQDLAGSIGEIRSVKFPAIRACAWRPIADPAAQIKTGDIDDLMSAFGARMTGELQRIRVNSDRRVFVIFDAGIGYVQCSPEPDSFYCEAQSADAWAPLASVLTPDRIERLHAAGFADPGRSPNYWRNYPIPATADAALAHELIAVLHDVYGYRGKPALKISTDQDR